MVKQSKNADAIPVWLDCDPGLDDVFAIVMCYYAPELDLLGISTVGGNQIAENCTRNACTMLWAIGDDDIGGIPVFEGCPVPLLKPQNTDFRIHGTGGGISGANFKKEDCERAYKNHFNKKSGILAMYEAIVQNKEKVTLIPTGALTNIALLIRSFPDVKDNIKAITLMGGGYKSWNVNGVAEFNIWVDPEAAQIVFHSGIPVNMVPLDLTHSALSTEDIVLRVEHVDAWEKNKTLTDEELEKTPKSPLGIECKGVLWFFKQGIAHSFGGLHYPAIHDPCAVFYVTNPDLFKGQLMAVDVVTRSDIGYGQTVCEPQLKKAGKTGNVYVTLSMDVSKFWDKFLVCLADASKNSPVKA